MLAGPLHSMVPDIQSPEAAGQAVAGLPQNKQEAVIAASLPSSTVALLQSVELGAEVASDRLVLHGTAAGGEVPSPGAEEALQRKLAERYHTDSEEGPSALESLGG